MRTALWETSAGALAALLNGGGPLNRADLYTLTLNNGTVYRWSGSDIALTGNGNTWAVGPGLTRGQARFQIGVSVDDLTVSMTDNVGSVINGQSLLSFVRSGGLIGSRMQVDKAYWPVGANAPTGAIYWFAGRVAGVAGNRYQADLTVRSDLDRLNINIPREIYQPQCRNTVFDSACTLSTTALAVTGAATGNSSADLTTFNIGLGNPAGYFSLGMLEMTSGANNGIYRSVKVHNAGNITVTNPWPFPVVSGDTFTVLPGCDGTQSTCTGKFSNVIHFRGFPYIPQASLILPGGS